MRMFIRKITNKRLIAISFSCFVGSVMYAVSMPAWSGESPVAERIQSCAEIQNPLERLVCFDELAQALAAAAAVKAEPAQAPQVAVRAAEPAVTPPEPIVADPQPAQATYLAEQRAAEAERRAREAERRAQEAESRAQEAEARRQAQARSAGKPLEGKTYVTIDEAWQNSRGLWFFRLSNGQVWRQQESGRFQFNPSARYYIEEGRFLNSYFMGTDGSNRRIRVQFER